MSIVKRVAMNGKIETNGELERAAKRMAFVCTEDVVNRALYDDLARQIAECHRLLNAHKIPNVYGTLHGRIDAALRYAEMRGACWDSEADEQEYRDYLQTIDDLQGRM